MEEDIMTLTVSAPGRICLFGEHQDYLGFNVISAAINRRIKISGNAVVGRSLSIDLPDITSFEKIDLDNLNTLKNNRDYLRSAFNLLKSMGVQFPQGFDCKIESTIPIKKGVSSSSAMVVAWIAFLLAISGEKENYSSFDIAKLAFKAEVEAFNEPGGMQDHLCAAIGGMLFMDFSGDVKYRKLKNKLNGFVLGDSLVQKDTIGVLSRIKKGFFGAVDMIKKDLPDIDILTASSDIADSYEEKLDRESYRIFAGALKIRDLTSEALDEVEKDSVDEDRIGELFNRHHQILRDNLSVSTPQINDMIDAALSVGAKGAKVNGSGGGGCFIVYCPKKENEVIEAIKKKGGEASKIEIDEGVRVEC
ncbi:MAG: GHMP kinase [Candidatus Schekmanbacteria bacterium]|nr:MAG: GHMP kinase [Candidatus Schekmanbacteria bacterium]